MHGTFLWTKHVTYHVNPEWFIDFNTYRILHEYSCFIDFIKRVGGNDKMGAFYLFFARSLINFIIQEHEC